MTELAARLRALASLVELGDPPMTVREIAAIILHILNTFSEEKYP